MVSITNMGGDMAPKIDELIENIPKDQIEILRKIWEYFLQTKEWPKGKPFRKEQGRLTVERVVTNLKLIFIWHMDKDNPSGEYYRLTTEGVFAVEGFEGPNIKLLLSYLDYLRKKFDENPAFEKVTATEVREILHKKSDDIRILGELLDMGNSRLWGRSASNLHSSDWEVGVIDDIEILYEANSSQEFLLKQWDDYLEWIITHNTGKTSGILGLQKSQLSDTDKNKNTKRHTKVKKSEEEVERRELVVLTRRLGTQIRKEMLIRHADTAKLNLPTIKKALRDIEEEEIGAGIAPLGEMMLQITREMERKFIKCNEIINTYNKITEDLIKEGIYCVKMEELPVRGETYQNLIMHKSTARDNLKQIMEFYQILEEYGEK